uniref:Uncharacterized protein n=1 Tax=Ditylenchus dipsaci TaxID=166011 RepID=A0A915E677_9BILA
MENDKQRVTVMLTAKSDGKKIKSLVLLPQVRLDKNIVEQFSQKMFLAWEGKIWMKDSRMEALLDNLIVD